LRAILQRATRNVVAVGLVGLTQIRGEGVGNRALLPHPVQRRASVDAVGRCDAHLLAGRKTLEDECHFSAAGRPVSSPARLRDRWKGKNKRVNRATAPVLVAIAGGFA
jgi:hypothetical protein